MLIGVPKEIKNEEYRVGLTPASVQELVHAGHKVIVETNAGAGVGLLDEAYIKAGASIVSTQQDIFAKADMVVKVKEPQLSEVKQLRENQILFTYLHLAADRAQAIGLQKSGCVAVAYETVTDLRGRLPLLAPMSEVAGRMSIQVGAHCLEKKQGGRGLLLGGVPGVAPAKVVVLGGGVAGLNAARMAFGLGANVTIIDRSVERLAEIDMLYGQFLTTQYATMQVVEEYVCDADLVIGAVLIPGASAPRLVTKEMVKCMRPGAVMVDISIDQGGCFETSRPTSHETPTYVVDDVVHYCVTNMPGAVARTSTFALNHVTLPYALKLANFGLESLKDPYFLPGLNVMHGHITHKSVASSLDIAYKDPLELI